MFGFISVLLLLAGNALYDNPTADRLIRQSMQATYNLDLPEARRAAQLLQSQFSDHPAGFTLMAETYWWEAQADPGNPRIEDNYFKAHELAVARAEAALKFGKYSKLEITAYLATNYGSNARFQITQRGAFFRAMRAGMKAHGYAEEVYKLDKNYYDIYVGLGAYNFFSDLVPAVIKPFAWLFGARGDKRLGTQQLRTAMEKARYGQTEAKIVYYTAMLEDGQYAEAFRTLEQLRSSYPDNYVLYIWATDWFRRQRKNLDGAEYFEKIFQDESKRAPLMAGYALLEETQLLIAQNRSAEGGKVLQRVRSLKLSEPGISRRIQSLERQMQK